MAETNIKDVKLKIGTETQFQSKLKDLPINTLVGTTDPIQEGELDTSIITKLNKAENAFPKPTNDTTGSAGQVLKKTANGSEWGDAPSGGGKLYLHKVTLGLKPQAEFKYISSDNAKFSIDKLNTNICFDKTVTDTNMPPKLYKVNDMVLSKDKSEINIRYFPQYPYSVAEQILVTISTTNVKIDDKIYEL